MIPKNQFITLALCLFGYVCFTQSNNPTTLDKDNTLKTYLIHVDDSADGQKYFPKLYPLGYILKQKNEGDSKTSYFLGDFKNDHEAKLALQQVKSLGYREAFIVDSTK